MNARQQNRGLYYPLVWHIECKRLAQCHLIHETYRPSFIVFVTTLRSN